MLNRASFRSVVLFTSYLLDLKLIPPSSVSNLASTNIFIPVLFFVFLFLSKSFLSLSS